MNPQGLFERPIFLSQSITRSSPQVSGGSSRPPRQYPGPQSTAQPHLPARSPSEDTMTTHPAQRDAYRTVAEAIDYIRRHARRQPNLSEVAAHVGLGEHHFQRLFSAWAGVSPKRFLQFLTKEHAKRLLHESHDVLDVAFETGLSGAGRLHDLMVVSEALTPGEIRLRGAGLIIHYGFAGTPLGRLVIGETARGICHAHFDDDGDDQAAARRLVEAWPRAEAVRDFVCAETIARRFFVNLASDIPLHLLLRGTNYLIMVWEALLRVPAGKMTSYRTLAQTLDLPKAQRAVGSDVARNNIAVLIPCHRVLRASGDIGEYRWGTTRKAALIEWEPAHKAGESDRNVLCVFLRV